MSIMDMFKQVLNAQPQQQPAGQVPANNTPGTPGNMPANAGTTAGATPGSAPNGVVPPGADTNTPAQSPLDSFNDFWKTTTTAKPADNGIFNIDPQKLQEHAAKENFASALNPELLQKINAGGAEAMQAMLEAMNTMSQQVYLKSALAATRFSEHAATTTASRLKDELPSTFKNLQVSETLASSNPALSHPSVQPLIELVKQQAIQKYPNATAADINKHAMEYINTVFSQVAPQTSGNTNGANSGNKTGDYDWSKFLQ